MGGNLRLDEIGPWSEVKLEIIREYAKAYSKILSRQQGLRHYYIDAFSGAGIHFSKKSNQYIPGSPTNALLVRPPFDGYHFIDLDKLKIEELAERSSNYNNVHIHEGNCNTLLLEEVFPQVAYGDYKRALCILDPYGLHLDWSVLATSAKMRSIEVFINFPIMDINRNVLWKNPKNVDSAQIDRLNAFWGDESWREVAYRNERTLFEDLLIKNSNEALAKGFRRRLQEVAGFKYVPRPMAMRNSSNAVLYYLYFAAHKGVANHIVEDIFNKWGRGYDR